MKYLIFSSFILLGCTSLKTIIPDRQIASAKNISDAKFDLSLSQPIVIPNGANRVVLSIAIKDASGNQVQINPSELEIITSIETKLQDGRNTSKGYEINLVPKIKSPSIKIFVSWKDWQSETIELKTTLAPLKDKMLPLPAGARGDTTINDISFARQDNFTEGQYEGFNMDNDGPNAIVNAEESQRSFSFEFEEQARQNISLTVQDAPNGFASHAMFSHFMFFPRLVIPFVEVQSNKDRSITLPNGENLVLSKNSEIIDGVFLEGAVDSGPDRHKRAYADLKYQGKGILLRANARGQLPQQGQFEPNKIDMEYGIKFSSDVLIINGTTGERCRRPKTDFWTGEDVSPIEFKFATDAEFNTYLLAKCKFTIPSLTYQSNLEIKDNSGSLVTNIWQSCKDDQEVIACVDDKIDAITDEFDRSRTRFSLKKYLHSAKLEEKETIQEKVFSEIKAVHPKLLLDSNWVSSSNEAQLKDACVKKSLTVSKLSFRFHDAGELMKAGFVNSCQNIRAELLANVEAEIQTMISPLSSDFTWVNLSSGQSLISLCQKEFLSRYQNLQYKKTPVFYAESLKSPCSQIEDSVNFKNWLRTQSAAVEAKLMIQVKSKVIEKTEERAKFCLEEFPMPNALQRLAYKKQREACLIDQWERIESTVIMEATEDNLAQKVGINEDNLKAALATERRANQLKLIKNYFSK